MSMFVKKKLDAKHIGLIGNLTVEIVGEASRNPITGISYIVYHPGIKSDFYPYNYFVIPEVFLQDIE